MQFNQGASVFTIDGHAVGRIDRVVIEANTDRVTHIVVRKGHLFTKDKVVPVDVIAAGQGERILLRVDLDQLERLPDFEETPVEETHLNIPERGIIPCPTYQLLTTIWTRRPKHPEVMRTTNRVRETGEE